MTRGGGRLLAGLSALVAGAGVAAVLGVVLLWPAAGARPEVSPPPTPLLDAILLEVTSRGPTIGLTPDAVDLEVVARLATGERVTMEIVDESGGTTFRPGQRVVLEEFVVQPGAEPLYAIRDVQRGVPLAVLVAVFVLAVVAFGRWSGVRALLGLAVSLVIVLAFVVPAVLAGEAPVAVALAGGVLIVLVTLYVAHGPSAQTTAAAAGTIVALAATVALAAVSVRAAGFTGLASEGAVSATVAVGGLSLQGLLLAGIILGVLGVLDDVTVAQASTVAALARTDPGLSRRALAARALTVGRDHIASTVNTLVLAYAGAALPLLILFALAVDPPLAVLTSEVVAVEVVRTLVGSLGLLVAVPVTTLFAAAVLHGRREPEHPRPWGASETTPTPPSSGPSGQNCPPEPEL